MELLLLHDLENLACSPNNKSPFTTDGKEWFTITIAT
jgi:hypothetical protein